MLNPRDQRRKETLAMTTNNKEPLVLQVGHTYVRADGSKHTIVGDGGGTYPMFSVNDWYDRSGMANAFGRKNDLIAEYKEPHADHCCLGLSEIDCGDVPTRHCTGILTTTEPKDEYGPWIGWNGGECPVAGLASVQVLLMDGVREINPDACDWACTVDPIIAYRVEKKKEPKVFTDRVWVDDLGEVWGTNLSGKCREAIILTKGDYIEIAWVDDKD